MKDTLKPDKITDYFKIEWCALLFTSLSGLIYNLGLMVVTIYEGKLAQSLFDIYEGSKSFKDMIVVAGVYLFIIIIVQTARYIKRFYVRRFANNTNRRMKQVLYRSLVHKSKKELEQESVGSVITKAISDVDDCVEGMRKFTTEVFDTGVAVLGYIGMMFYYDWKIALLCLIFPPMSYVIAEKMKALVQRMGAAYKESAARLSSTTLDRMANSMTYRVYGCEKARNEAYEDSLLDYEKAAVRSQILGNALQPIYHVISMVSVLFILVLGGKNVTEHIWDIGIFTAYISCFGKLSVRASKSAKLFNAVHKAQVSWKRIYPLMKRVPEKKEYFCETGKVLRAEKLEMESVFKGLSFEAKPGQIIGVTGPVASGKTVLGKVFLQEEPYLGRITYGGKDFSSQGNVSYLGHSLELFSDTIENNILLGDEGDAWEYLRAVELDKEVAAMPEQLHTKIGTGGRLLSGGQKQRLALARALAHPRGILILDDPFSALDKDTEWKVYQNLRAYTQNSIVFLISHRLYVFPELDQVIWMENGVAEAADHGKWMEKSALYRELYKVQNQEVRNHE